MVFENITLEGGGIKGFAYIGVLKALVKLNKINDINKIVGTSVGSICALIFALKPTDEEIDKYIDLVIKEILNLNNSWIEEGYLLCTSYGMHNNDCIKNVIDKVLLDKIKKSNVTFEELFNYTNIELTIVGTCISERKPYYFNYITSPDMIVSTAIQISTSLPVFYACTKYDDKVWVDGGVCDNFAIDYFDTHETENPFTLGITHTGDDERKGVHDVSSIQDLVLGVISTCMTQMKESRIKNIKSRNIICIDTGDISTIDFNITPKKREHLEKVGYDSTMNFFTKKPLSWKETVIKYFF
jgi:predicted acylesterase/phospholipase RssA